MTAQAPKPRRRTPLTVCQLEDRTTPTTLGAFGAVPQLGSLVYEATGTGSLGSVVASDGFESGSLGPAWSTYSSSADGRIQVTGAFGTASGADALLMDTQASAVYNLNEAVWHVQAPGAAAPVLRFSHASYNHEIDALGTAPYTGHHTGDGVSVSNDGVT